MRRHNLKINCFVSLISFLFFLLLLECGLRLGGYIYLHKLISEGRKNSINNTPNTILTIGDSYTVGGNGKWEDNYPSQLQKLLSKNHPQQYTVINGGICEANSAQTLSYLSNLIKNYSIDTVILLVGSANRFNPIGYQQNKIEGILSHLRLYKIVKIFVVNLRAKLFSKEAKKNARKQLKAKHDYAYNKTGDFTEKTIFCDSDSAKEYQQEIIREPTHTDAYYQLIDCYNEQGKYEEAESLYNTILAKGLDTEYASMKLGENYQKQGKHIEAEALYQKLIANQPSLVWAYARLTDSYVMRDKFEEAEQLFKRALEFNTSRDIIYDSMANFYDKRGQYTDAALCYKKSLELNPKLHTYTGLAWSYIQLGQFDEAIEIFINVINLYPNEFDNYYALLKSYEFQNKYSAENLLALFSKLGEKNPTLKKSKEFQSYIFFLKNRAGIETTIDIWLEDDLEKVVALCGMNNIHLIIQNYPYAYHSANRVLENVASKNNVTFIDNYSIFNKFLPEEKAKYFSDFDHCTKEGHWIMANNIYNVLKTIR